MSGHTSAVQPAIFTFCVFYWHRLAGLEAGNRRSVPRSLAPETNTPQATASLSLIRSGVRTPQRRTDVGLGLNLGPAVQVRHPGIGSRSVVARHARQCCSIRVTISGSGAFAGWHPMGKKSRTPSVEARVVGTRQQFRKSKERLFFLLDLHFLYPVSIFLLLFLHFFLFCWFLVYFTRIYFLLVFGFFFGQRVVGSNQSWGWHRGAAGDPDSVPISRAAGPLSHLPVTVTRKLGFHNSEDPPTCSGKLIPASRGGQQGAFPARVRTAPDGRSQTESAPVYLEGGPAPILQWLFRA